MGLCAAELRNPLHVVETWFKPLADSTLTTDDRAMAVSDMENALLQMRCTVNDVLDFRAVRVNPPIPRSEPLSP